MNIEWQEIRRDYFDRNYKHISSYTDGDLSHLDIDQPYCDILQSDLNDREYRSCRSPAHIDIVDLSDANGLCGYIKYVYTGIFTC